VSAGKLTLVAGAALALLLSSLACCGVPDLVREGIRVDWPWTIVRGSGDIGVERRTETGFSGVALRGIGHLVVEQGDKESVQIEAEDNLLPYLETRVEGTMLIVETRSGVHLRPTHPIVVRVAVDDLDRLEVSGSGDVEGDGLEVDDLALVVTGSGGVALSGLKADALQARISGSGTAEVSGAAESLDLTISGSGDYRGRNLAAAEADVRISGSGSALVNASDRLDATITGSGSVRYVGSPTLQSTVTGSGSIRQAGE
jgi:hypothetical protein